MCDSLRRAGGTRVREALSVSESRDTEINRRRLTEVEPLSRTM